MASHEGDPERTRRRLTPAAIASLRERVAARPDLRAHSAKVQALLVRSEGLLLRAASHTTSRGFVTAAPSALADPDFAHVPFWLNYPATDEMRAVADLWRSIHGQLPPTHLNPQTYAELLETLKAVFYVGPDGSIFGDGPFQMLDPAGIPMFGEYLWHYFFEDFAAFNTAPPVVRLDGSASDSVRIAIVGDWGTGPYAPGGPAADVMRHVVALKPDYIIHLGDVYYSGTANEERGRLLAGWGGRAGRSFTLNSNHEMCNGGYGYFDVAIADSRFNAQRGCSYCALQFGTTPQGDPWTILLLDSAYWSTSPLVMNGSLCNPDSSRHGSMSQLAFIKSLNLAPQNVIVVTHHNPIAFDGSSTVDDGDGNNLWEQVKTALGEPAAWDRGHIHNGIVYTTPIVGSTGTRGRCIGHAAIPFGPASGLAQSMTQPKHVEWYAHTPNPDPAVGPRVFNGFSLMTLTGSGQVTDVFYDQRGSVVQRPASYQLGDGN